MSTAHDTRQIQTRQGDTIDAICYRYFNATKSICEQVLALNPEHAHTVIFDAGVTLLLPVQHTQTTTASLNLWD